jgi:hypothetical protein
MTNEILTIDGKKYLRIGDKAVLIDHFDGAGKPVVSGVWSEETPNAAGGQDCTVHVPCFQIAAATPKIG